MKRKLEDQIAEKRNMKDNYAQLWVGGLLGSIIMAIFGIVTSTQDYIVISLAVLLAFTVVISGMFVGSSKREQELMNKLEKQNLEERIEELEQSL